MKQSLWSAAVGLVAAAFTMMVVFAPSEAPRLAEWPGYVVIGIMYGAPLVAVVWLLLLWPLYVLVPTRSVLWQPLVCIPAGAFAGGLLYVLLVWLILRWPLQTLLSYRHVLIGLVAGAVTCAVGYRFKAHEHQLA